jgi:hypothetical protein
LSGQGGSVNQESKLMIRVDEWIIKNGSKANILGCFDSKIRLIKTISRKLN